MIIYKGETDSTNLDAARLAEELSHGDVIVADAQTAGRGRRGRTWVSRKGENLYFSMLLKPDFAPEKASMLTLVMALAVAQGMETVYACRPQIKWPNDLMLSSKKVCGILTKLITENGKINFALIGIGINVLNDEKDFPDDIKNIATSLKIESGKIFDRKMLAEKIVASLDEAFIMKKFSEHEAVEELKKRSCVLNKKVFIKSEMCEYFAVDISPDGGLVVEDNGERKVIHSGEIELF